MLDFLNRNAGAFSVLFSFVVTGATLVYAWLTWKLVSETRAMRVAQTEPKVAIALSPHLFRFGFVDLVLVNEGVGAAYDVSFKIRPGDEVDPQLLQKLTDLGMIKRGLRYMSPRQEIRTFFASMIERDERRMNTNIFVIVSYRSSGGAFRQEEYLLDFSPFWGYGALGRHPLVRIEEELENIQKHLAVIGTPSRRFEIRPFSPEEEQREHELTWLHPKLNRLDASAFSAVEALVDERLCPPEEW